MHSARAESLTIARMRMQIKMNFHQGFHWGLMAAVHRQPVALHAKCIKTLDRMERGSRCIDRLEQCSAFPWMSKEKYLIATPVTQRKQEANLRWSRWELRIKPFSFFSSTRNLQQPSHVPLPPPPPPLNPLVPPLASVEASSSLPYRPDFIGSWVALGASFLTNDSSWQSNPGIPVTPSWKLL